MREHESVTRGRRAVAWFLPVIWSLTVNAAFGDTAVLTPQVRGRVDTRAREEARRIGSSLRRALASPRQMAEARTLAAIAEPLDCDRRSPSCLREVATMLGVDHLITGELFWDRRTLVLLEYRAGRTDVITIEASVTDDVLERAFEAWVEHLRRRLAGTREGIVVFNEKGDRPHDVLVRLGPLEVPLGRPLFAPAGRHPVALDRNGERLTLGSVVVHDGRRLERFINFRDGALPDDEEELRLDELFVDHIRSGDARVSVAGMDANGGVLDRSAILQIGAMGRSDRWLFGVEYDLGASTGGARTGFTWAARLRGGVATSPDRRFMGSLTAGVGGGGTTGLVDAAFEIPVRARLSLHGPLRPSLVAGIAFVLDEDRADGTRLAPADEAEVSLELVPLRWGHGRTHQGLGVHLVYREAHDQRIVGLRFAYSYEHDAGRRNRPTLTETPEPLDDARSEPLDED